MNKKSFSIFAVFALVLVLQSCIITYQARKEIKPTLQVFHQDSTSIRAIFALDTYKLFFAGSDGYFGFTEDSGNTWNRYKISFGDSLFPNFRSIAYNGKDIFLLSIENPALLYKISDDKAELVYTEKHPKVFYDSMAFFDNQNGIAMGDPTDECLSIITTHDGGNTWHKKTCTSLPKVVKGEAAFAASNTNIKILDDTVWIVSGGKKARIFKSLDKGKTWEVYDTPIVQGSGAQGIYSVDFYDKKNGIIFGGDYSKPSQKSGNKAITKDGGKTWQLISDGKEPGYKSCVKYIPNTRGKEIMAVGKTGISYSYDSGKTWQKISDASFFSIQFIDSQTAWLGGYEKIGLLHF